MKAYRNYSVTEIETLRELYRNSAETFGSNVFLRERVDGEYREFSFKKLADDIEALGTELCAQGLIGKKIIVMGNNCYAWALSYLAVACGVGVVIPVNRDISAEGLASIVERTQAAAIIASDSCAVAQGLSETVRRISFGELPDLIESGNQRIIDSDRTYLDMPLDPNEMRVLVFTAGSNGISKGVMLSHRNLCFNLSEMCRMVYIDHTDHFLSVLPLHHVYECTCGLLCPLYRGSSVTFCESLRYLTRDLREAQPTVLLCVPMLAETVYRKIWSTIRKQGLERRVKAGIRLTNAMPEGKMRDGAKRKLFAKIHESFGGKLRLMISGGAAADPDVLKGLRDFGIRAYQSYSLSECAPLAAINRDTYYRDASAGMATPNALLDIYDVQEDGVGEIRIKAPNVMLGYYDMPEKTQRAIRDGWFYTGDLGHLDDDGFLYIVGRKKNVISAPGGKSVFPEELEALLTKNDYVKEAVVIGIPNRETKKYDVIAIIHPDYAQMVQQYGKNFAKSQLDLEMKKALSEVNTAVLPYKRIQSYIVQKEEFPKNSSRKIDRTGIADAYASMISE